LQQFACRASACIIVTVLPAWIIRWWCWILLQQNSSCARILLLKNSSCAGILMNRGVIFVLNVRR
jgi:hypothetical protein